MKAFRDDNEGLGFTLIELLVVIAIIAILAALLLPALVRVPHGGYGYNFQGRGRASPTRMSRLSKFTNFLLRRTPF